MSETFDGESMETALERLIEERFGSYELPMDYDDMSREILYYHDLRQVLATPGIAEELRSIRSFHGAASDQAQQLSELTQRVEGLRTVLFASRNSGEAAQLYLNDAFISEPDASRLMVIVEIYSEILERVGGPGRIQYVHADDEAIQRCIDEDLIERYLDDLHKSRRWLQPVETLINTDAAERIFTGESLPSGPQGWLVVFFDEGHYLGAIERFEQLNEPFLADVARAYLLYARLLQSTSQDRHFLESVAPELRAILDRLQAYDQLEWQAFGDVKGFIMMIPGLLRLILGFDTGQPAADRARDLLSAENFFEATDVILIKPLIPAARLARSELAEGPQRDKLAASAFSRINELLAQSALEKEPLARLGTMTSLMALPASWKYLRGDFVGAIEASATAKSMAEAFLDEAARSIGSTLETLAQAIDEEDSPEERDQLVTVQDRMIKMLEGMKSVVLLADLNRLMSEASLAERNGDFFEASRLYQEAGRQEKEAMERIYLFMSVFASGTASSSVSRQGLQHQARAAYFDAMAMLNEGDRNLMNGEYSEANRIYLNARLSFKSAEDLWAQEILRISKTAEQAQQKPRSEMLVSASRARYCDAKIEISNAEQASAVLRQPTEASRHFDTASYIIAEALETSATSESRRSIGILRASEDLCRGRAILELAIAKSGHGNFEEGVAYLDSATSLFEQAGELRWADYVRGVLYEYETTIYQGQAQTAGAGEANSFLMLARQRAKDAANQFRRLGLNERANEMEYRARRGESLLYRRPPGLTLPKPASLSTMDTPADGFTDLPESSQRRAEDIKLDIGLTKLQAMVIAQSRQLADLERRRDSGALDDGRYSSLAAHLDEERIKRLLEIKSLLGGQGEEIDAIIQEAVQEKDTAALTNMIVRLALRNNIPLNARSGIVAGQLAEAAPVDHETGELDGPGPGGLASTGHRFAAPAHRPARPPRPGAHRRRPVR